MDHAQPKRAIRRADVIKLTGISRTSIYTLEKAGEFPKHWMLSPRIAVWDLDEVRDFLARKQLQATASTLHPDVQLRKTAKGRVSKKQVSDATWLGGMSGAMLAVLNLVLSENEVLKEEGMKEAKLIVAAARRRMLDA